MMVLLVQVGGVGDQVPALVPSLIQVIGVAPLVVYPVSHAGVGGHVGGCII